MRDSNHRRSPLRLSLLALAALAACTDAPTSPEPSTLATLDNRASSRLQCDANNANLTLPSGFCAIVVADLVMNGSPAAARHLIVTPDGNIFVAINARSNQNPSFGIIGLRDNDGDGKADQQSQFSPGLGGSGLDWKNALLYFGANDRVLRFRLPAGELMPVGSPDVVVSGLPNTGDHISKDLVIGDDKTLFVNIGSASNSCQVANRQAQSPGVFPCPELPVRAGVWKFNARATNQTEADGEHFGTGLRNMVALAINPMNNGLYGVQQGRDMLFENWPQFFTVEQDAVLPAEEFIRITKGVNNGWPYCFFDDVFEHKKVLAPEFGGNGHLVSGGPGIDCSTYNQPLLGFGAHWSPDGLHFYSGKQFPARYRGGAFVAFHGGFDRAPLPNEGFNVVFVPMGSNGAPSGAPEIFADGFAESAGPLPATARHRPVGVTEGPDGSLYIADDRGGRIYRIIYTGG